WVDAGMLMGNPDDAPPVPDPPPSLSDANVTVEMSVDYAPMPPAGRKVDDYRCFVVDPKLDADGFLTAYEVVPGNPKVVHHVILFSLRNEAAEQDALVKDAAEERPGYECFGDSGVSGSDFVAAWAPGVDPTYFPDGTGIALKAKRKIIMQVHY